MSAAAPSTSRRRDKVYIIFLMSYVSTMLLFDAVPLYPVNFIPAPLIAAQEFYKEFFNDQLVATQPHWFHFFTYVELIYQLPVVLWAILALSTKSPKAPAHLLVWASVCFITTVTCIYEFYENQLMTETQKTRVIGAYGLYAVIFGVIGVDMFCRIQKVLGTAASLGNEKKRS